MGEDYIDRLRKFQWGEYGVVLAVLFGSRLGGRVVKGDWDLAVWLDDADKALDLQYALAKYLHVHEWDVDLVVLNNYEYLPCTLIISALGGGKAVYYRDLGTYLELRTRLLFPCFDFMLDSEKLELLKTQVKSAMGRWGNREIT
ncbi:MAG: nucleotidyltransferase domain-containing protein [Vulcanisaeta sp.]|nr:nucleotidyltransferase domain-containing protein [Vulcanisaeta sp.]MCG2870411.1 nucleotidyltransferase domain-containing protein [Vulcanisaeta sp.]MCG2887570.1 nucleotidyltransferase domain-containing protein [Vulcanisaeta sp.]